MLGEAVGARALGAPVALLPGEEGGPRVGSVAKARVVRAEARQVAQVAAERRTARGARP